VIVPRFGHSAVDRNLVKRRLRELARTEVLPVVPALDVVIRAAPSAYGKTMEELRAVVRSVVSRMARSGTEKHE
jgi:ribonuclease P protein component